MEDTESMTKDELLSRLQECGFKAIKEDGCVIVLSGDKGDLHKIEKIAKSGGYVGTLGWSEINSHEKRRKGVVEA